MYAATMGRAPTPQESAEWLRRYRMYGGDRERVAREFIANAGPGTPPPQFPGGPGAPGPAIGLD